MAIHWLLVMMALVAGAQGWVYARLGQRRLDYTRSFSEVRCFAGDRIAMVERIANRKLLPLPWLRVESLLHAGLRFEHESNLDISSGEYMQNHKSFFSMMPYTQITRTHHVTCTKRGIYTVQGVSLTCGDALGMNRTTRRVALDARLTVYPLPLLPDELALPSQSWQGDLVVQRWIVEDPFMTSGVRAYRPGDSLKSVNWKATARTGGLQVHQHDTTADHRLMIVLNIEDHERMWNVVNDVERAELGISYAAGLAEYAVRHGMEAGFATNARASRSAGAGVRVGPSAGDAHLSGLYETMAHLEVQAAEPFADLLAAEAEQSDGRLDYCVLTAYVNEGMQARLDELSRRGHGVRVLRLPPTERESGKGGVRR
ncbi:DUF58 domain-containing protein [Paenibacillus sp. IB182496]|uniref:DUF58 domain-containing protein n=1 Tax=Paenibacillus sabuli TaxID=2772509 RepID=A0A927GTE9_9BACL|nr:DUF58 domain-containing protein [Paenibacillus sabuli]MBD2847754.1 DUF58 domain-containing protein [Paenibacillus sabuli]